MGVLWIRESIKLLYSLRCGVMNDPMKRRTVLTLGQFQLQVQENNIKTVSFSDESLAAQQSIENRAPHYY